MLSNVFLKSLRDQRKPLIWWSVGLIAIAILTMLFYPSIRDVHLIDYKVRVVNARAGSAARVRVIIESRDKNSIWGTVGVSENIIEASWLALVDSVEYKLQKEIQ